jgi:hypothetical protein
VIFLDVESCGFHGPAVLLQYAEDGGAVTLHEVWHEPAQSTLDVIEYICSDVVCAFNLSFDWFHVCKIYTMLSIFVERYGPAALPKDYIEELAIIEKEARDGKCVKPLGALDLMLHARKGPYQSTMGRKDIRIKRVPNRLAPLLVNELDDRVKFSDVYFAKRKTNKDQRWQVVDIENEDGDIDPDFKDVVLRFAPSTALKALVGDALGLTEAAIFEDIRPPEYANPTEYGYAPYALAFAKPPTDYRVYWDWQGGWPEKISMHIAHWRFHRKAREYAEKDVTYLQLLYDYFGRPASNDDDSILAAMVGAVRWRGFKLDLDAIKQTLESTKEHISTFKLNFNSTKVCREYLEEVLSLEEKTVIEGGTNKMILLEISKWTKGDVCEACFGFGCGQCNEGVVPNDEKHPAAVRADEILDFRTSCKQREQLEKLIFAERLHPDLNVIGAKSSRMSGRGGLNAQGIKRDKWFRKMFPLAFGELVLCGGDFISFEVSLLDAAYNDPKLREQLMRTHKCYECNGTGVKGDDECGDCKGSGQEGYKIHALFGVQLFPPHTYEQIMETKKYKGHKNLYSRAKSGVFALAYGGEAHTLKTRVGVDAIVAEEAYQRWIATYKVWGQKRKEIIDAFCTARQRPDGKFYWKEPEDYIESMFGFKRFFTAENRVAKAIFELAERPPKEWRKYTEKVVRRSYKGEQTASGAMRSALYGCVCQIQGACARQAGNHLIQSAGATTTKDLQARLWALQPSGVNDWLIQPLNIHDEIMAPTHPSIIDKAVAVKDAFLEELIEKVPLAGIDWGVNLDSWAAK